MTWEGTWNSGARMNIILARAGALFAAAAGKVPALIGFCPLTAISARTVATAEAFGVCSGLRVRLSSKGNIFQLIQVPQATKMLPSKASVLPC